jgi:hypothetical protein
MRLGRPNEIYRIRPQSKTLDGRSDGERIFEDVLVLLLSVGITENSGRISVSRADIVKLHEL